MLLPLFFCFIYFVDFRVIVLLDLLNAYHRYIYYLRWYTSFCTVADTLQNENTDSVEKKISLKLH